MEVGDYACWLQAAAQGWGLRRGALRLGEGVEPLTSVAQPTSAIILIGDSETETPAQQENRSNFVRGSNLIDVVSYRRILFAARGDVGFTVRGPGILAETFRRISSHDDA